MFREWGFLLTVIWVLLALAALLGLLAGWIIWGRRSEVNVNNGEVEKLRSELETCRSKHAKKDAEISDLRGKIAAAAAVPTVVSTLSPTAAEASSVEGDYDGDGIAEGKEEGVKPETLDGPRGGTADDLKRIKGIGPQMEKLCNELGFWHFDQIAKWTEDEVAWVDANLEGFNGRVTRDEWVEQARLLAAGGETAFSQIVDKGDVY